MIGIIYHLRHGACRVLCKPLYKLIPVQILTKIAPPCLNENIIDPGAEVGAYGVSYVLNVHQLVDEDGCYYGSLAELSPV